MNLGKNWIYYIVSNNKFPTNPMENVDYFRNALVGLAHLGWYNSKNVEPDLILIARYEGHNFNPLIHSPVVWNEECGMWNKLIDSSELKYLERIPYYQGD